MMQAVRALAALRPAMLAIAGAVSLSACGGGGGGDGSSVEEGGNDSPLAELHATPEALTGETVVLDAARSSDPDGDALAYDWELVAQPDGSAVTLEEKTGAQVQFSAATPGRYEVELRVADGNGGQGRAHQTITVLSRIAAYLPQADLGPDRIVPVGVPVDLALDLPFDANGDGGAPNLSGISAEWRLAVQPETSDASISSDRFSASFTPHRAGRYEVSVTLSRGEQSHRFERNIVAGEPRQSGLRALPASGALLVREGTFHFIRPVGLDPAEVGREPDGTRVLRTEIDVEFGPDATVAEVNTMLDEIGGGIVAMNARTDSVLVRVPDPGTLQDLDNLIGRVEQLNGVAEVGRSVLYEKPRVAPSESGGTSAMEVTTGALPGGIVPGNTQDMGRTDHQLAVRGHGAWNMREAIPSRFDERPWFVIADFFGDGEPDGDYNAITRAADYGNFPAGGDNNDCGDDESCRHGYHVLGIVLGNYGGGPGGQNRDDVTGMFPGNLRVRAVDMANDGPFINSDARTRRLMIRHMSDIIDANGNDARIVVNTSIGAPDKPDDDGRANRLARKYAKAIRRNNLEDNVVHATSAGNTGTDSNGNTTRWPARINSGFTYATLGDITGPLGADPPELDNILVVENRNDSVATSSARPAPQCLNNSSLFSGNISAIGNGVWSFGRATRTNPNGSAAASDSRGASGLNGTSMASPQVAGVAAFAWAVDSSRSGPQMASHLEDLARSDYTSSCGTTPQPVVDALDVVRAAGKGGAEPRRSLQDVASGAGTAGSDGAFDADDVALALNRFSSPAVLNYGPLDFNGDGWTDGSSGSSRTQPVDLDGDSSRGTVQQTLAGYDRSFDETAATDLDVLCFDAYGTPFNGSTTDRNRLLGEPCGIVDVNIRHPSPGTHYTEGERIEVEANITVNGPNDGTAELFTGGSKVDDRSWGHTFSSPARLDTRRVCASSPDLTVRFDDAQTGLRAEDSIDVQIHPAALEAVISGTAPRYVRVKPGPTIDPMAFSGKGHQPTCEDPFSERIPQGNLAWLDDSFSRLPASVADVQSPPTDMTLFEDYLADGNGGFEQRRIALRYDDGSRRDTDTLWVKPCSSDLGLADAVPGYPECPTGAVAEGVVEDLRRTFEVASSEDLQDRLSRIINGEPAHRGLLDELGQEPCDPRFCDPKPPGFPAARPEIIDALTINEYDPVAIDYVDQMFGVLAGAETAAGARESLQALMDNVRQASADGTLDSNGRALVQAAYSTTIAALEHFASIDEGGSNGWSSFLTQEQQERLPEGAALQPARRGLAGFLTVVTERDVRTGFEEASLAQDGGGYGAAIGAGEVYLSGGG